EDVKDYYFYLDSTPTHAYMRGLYKYPQAEFPYARLVEENRRRGKHDPEFELVDTGVFDDDRYWDVVAEYAKATPDDLLIRITITTRGPEPASLHVLPTLWYRNSWSWEADTARPRLRRGPDGRRATSILVEHPDFEGFRLHAEGASELLFTENETNHRLDTGTKQGPYVKDAFHEAVVHGNIAAVNPAQEGSKAALHYRLRLGAGESAILRLRLASGTIGAAFGKSFDGLFAERRDEADEFYGAVIPAKLSDDATSVMRQALAGMLWSKQWYHYDVRRWLEGDPTQPSPPPERRAGRNAGWTHLYNDDVISMPDKWEYPWYAAWDLAFHTIALALVDPEFAKGQLTLF